jgi:hypothetical protein
MPVMICHFAQNASDDLSLRSLNSSDDLSLCSVNASDDLSLCSVNASDDLSQCSVNASDDLSLCSVNACNNLWLCCSAYYFLSVSIFVLFVPLNQLCSLPPSQLLLFTTFKPQSTVSVCLVYLSVLTSIFSGCSVCCHGKCCVSPTQ